MDKTCVRCKKPAVEGFKIIRERKFIFTDRLTVADLCMSCVKELAPERIAQIETDERWDQAIK